MTMNPETGEGFDAVKVDESTYFDPNATDPENYPGSLGLTMKKSTYWQGDVQFDTFDVVGPKFGPKWPDGTMKTGGLGTDADVWGLSTKKEPPPGYAPWLHNGVPGAGTAGGTNIFTKVTTTPDGTENVFHEWTPCVEDDGSPTLGDYEQRGTMDITILGAYGGDIKIPVMPEEFGADFTHEYWTPRVVGLGEIILPGGQSMETISWDSFFPRHYDSDYCNVSPTELEDPKSLTARIIWTMRFKMNCMLIVGGGIWNDQIVITNFNYRHKAGEIDDIYYTISCKRYRAPVVSTSPNPDAGKDRWYKDPRRPGGGIDSTDLTPQQEGAPPVQDPSPEAVTVEPDPDVPPPFIGPQRNTTITIETDTIKGQPAKGIRDPGGPHAAFSETFQDAVFRLAKSGPNTMASMLELNQWVTDNNYNPYTSQLPVGSGVKYYKDIPVTAGPTTTMTNTIQGNILAPDGGVLPSVISPPIHPSPLNDLGAILNPTPNPDAPSTGNVPANTPVEVPRTGGIRR
jgi:hypothetical protein